MERFTYWQQLKLHNESKGETRLTMKKILVFILAISMVILAACGGEDESPVSKGKEETPVSKSEEKLTVFKSEDNKYQVSASNDWEDADGELHPDGDLQINNLKKEKYFLALLESKEDFTDYSLQEYYDDITEPFLSSFENSDQGDVKSVTINGNEALQYTLEGEMDGLNIVYLITIIETPTHYGQLMAWTLKSKWDENKDEYMNLVNSFEEVN